MNCQELSRLSAHRIQQCRLLHTRKVFRKVITYSNIHLKEGFNVCAQIFRKFKLYFGTTLHRVTAILKCYGSLKYVLCNTAEDGFFLSAFMHKCTCMSPSPERPTHSPAWSSPGLGGCTEAVEGEVLHNRVDPLTSKGHHTKSLPLHLPDVKIQAVG